MDRLNYCPKRRFAQPVRRKNTKISNHKLNHKQQKKQRKNRKKSKRDADSPTPEDVCEELKDGQWPDPSDCKSYFLCRGVGTQWGEQKREVCYTGAYFDPNEKTCKWVGMDKINCEELVEGYDNPVAGITKSSDNESNTDDADGDDDDDDDGGGSSKTKKNKSSSSKSISILSRTTSEFDTCASEKSVEFDPVQGTLCYSCDSPKENSDCQISPNQTTTIMCETKQQVCYSKKTTNAAGKLLQFSRGCSMPPSSTINSLSQQAQCMTSKAEGKTICVKYCQANQCNHQDISDGASAVTVNQITLIAYYLLALLTILSTTQFHA